MGRKAAQRRRKKAHKVQQHLSQEYLAMTYGPEVRGRDDGTNTQSSPASERTGGEVSQVGGNLPGGAQIPVGKYRSTHDEEEDSHTESTSDDEDHVEVIEKKNGDDPWSTIPTQGSSFSPH